MRALQQPNIIGKNDKDIRNGHICGIPKKNDSGTYRKSSPISQPNNAHIFTVSVLFFSKNDK